MTLTIEEDRLEVVEKLLKDAMGDWHAYYAMEALRSGVANHLVALIDDRPAGAVIYYNLPTVEGGQATVVYYVVVADWARNEYVGRALVLSVEEVTDSQAYMATIAGGNEPSIRMFKSIGYDVVTYQEVEAAYGHRVLRKITRAACGYEDAYIAYKPPGKGLEVLSKLDWPSVELVFQKICYEPWRRLKERVLHV